MFKGRKLIIATKHEKDKVIKQILEKKLGVECYVPPDFDSDLLGTFTGEIERQYDPLTTARNKCLMAMELTGGDLAIANEGSFGPHPALYFVPADDELVIFIDKKNGLEIVVREISTETNFNGEEISTVEELMAFAKDAQFPSHGLILRKAKDDFTDISKGITDQAHLIKTFNYFIDKYGTAYIETDMRAMYNPTRMHVIGEATKKLADKINTHCTQCNTPGFGITDVKSGLPCSLCNFPTRSTLSYIYTCQNCSYSKEEMYPKGKLKEDPMYCDLCNP